MKAVKAVKFSYTPTAESYELLENFRRLVNHVIRIGLNENIRGRLRLCRRIYRELRGDFGILSCFPYSIAEVAWSILKKHRRWHRPPIVRRLMMKMDASNYTLYHGIISLPFKKGHRLLLPLNYGDYQRRFLLDSTLKRGSVTVTENSVIIAFSRETHPYQPTAMMGYDINIKSIVGSNGCKINLSEVTRIHTLYGIRRGKFFSKHLNDSRLRKKFASSRREKERVSPILHKAAKTIVQSAKLTGNAIVLEKLKGIRYSHSRGSGESRKLRRAISLWSFRRLQSYIEYKAAWAGVPVVFVNGAYTSKTCSNCGFVNRKLKLGDREWLCPSCGVTHDRDFNAAVNIERRGKIQCLGEVRPGARGTDEAMREEFRRQETADNPPSRRPEVDSLRGD